MDPEDANRTEVVSADRLGALNREEAINELLLIDPSLPKPLLELLLEAVQRENVIKLKEYFILIYTRLDHLVPAVNIKAFIS